MAIAGDILIKVAADLAEFTAGMTEASGKLDEFGKHAKETGDKVQSFIGLVKAGVAALGLEELARQALAYGEALQKQASDLTTQAAALGLTTTQLEAYEVAALAAGQHTDVMTSALSKFNVFLGEAQRGGKAQIDTLTELGVKIIASNGQWVANTDVLQQVATKLSALPAGAQRAAIEVTAFGKAGQQINPVLQELTQNVGALQAKFAEYIVPEETTKRLDEANTKMELSKRALAALASQLVSPLGQTFIDAAIALLKELEALSYRVGDGLRAIGLLDTPRTAASELARLNGEIAIATKNLEYLTDAQAKASSQGVAQNVLRDMDKRAAALAQQKSDLENQRNALQAANFPNLLPALPAVTVTGTANPPVAGAGQSTDEAIKRLQGEAAAATKAYNTLIAGFNQPLEELTRAVNVTKQIDDTVAKLGAKAPPGYEAALRTAATAADEARAKFAQLQQDEAAADVTQRKLGDGTVAYAKVLQDLTRQLQTHRLDDVAFTRALKEQTEQVQLAALAARRYDDNLGSLTAGFEEAAQRYARANDLFSQGGALFNNVVSIMNEGLDSLSGNSTKTFGQIALDFAKMLEQMALRAAASAVFGAIFGGAGGMAGAGTPGNPFFGPVAPGGGGGILSWLGGLISGGGRQAGGSVQPGMYYTVGEHGPERFVPTAAGSIQPMGMGSGGGVTVNLDMGQTQGAADPSAALEFGRRVKAAVVDVIANEKRPGGTLYARHNA